MERGGMLQERICSTIGFNYFSILLELVQQFFFNLIYREYEGKIVSCAYRDAYVVGCSCFFCCTNKIVYLRYICVLWRDRNVWDFIALILNLFFLKYTYVFIIRVYIIWFELTIETLTIFT